MSLLAVSIGDDAPNVVNAIIEIPANSGSVKYEVDKASGALTVDRFLATPMHYPCNYGYIPQTLCGDGDPIDILVVTPFPLLAGSVVACRPIGLLEMEDEAGEDTKLIAVPTTKLCPLYQTYSEVEDLPAILLDGIIHFFNHYKDLESGKWVKTQGWKGSNAAKQEIEDAIARLGGQKRD